jgi:hypothetical protein
MGLFARLKEWLINLSQREPINRYYVSNLDRFLEEFDKKPEAYSASRRAEEAEYARIDELRDNPNASEPKKQIWEGF